jgi:hypothetical protein
MLLQTMRQIHEDQKQVKNPVVTSPSPYILRWYEIRIGRFPFLASPSPTLTVGDPDWMMWIAIS